MKNAVSPGGAMDGNARFLSPLPGLGLVLAENRWFAPPANLRLSLWDKLTERLLAFSEATAWQAGSNQAFA